MSVAFTKKSEREHTEYTNRKDKAKYQPDFERAITKAMMHLAIRDRISGNIQYGDYVR